MEHEYLAQEARARKNIDAQLAAAGWQVQRADRANVAAGAGVAIREFDLRIEQVAWSLGASWSYTGRKVMLPNLAPSVFAAWIFAFIGSFDEVIVTSFVAGKYETVPKKMFNELILEVNPTITAVATLLIAFTVLALAAVTVILGRTGKLRQTLA